MWRNLFLGCSRGHALFTVWLIFNLNDSLTMLAAHRETTGATASAVLTF